MHIPAFVARALAPVAVGVLICATVPAAQHAPKFLADDPLAREPETQDAAKVKAWDIGLVADLTQNLFVRPGDPAENVRARNVNTIDEVPDSSWFTNRIYARPLSVDEVARGANTLAGPAPGRWTMIRAKSSGVTAGFTARDGNGEVWFVSFDKRGYPVAATAAILVAARLFWALGYNQAEQYIAHIRRADVVVGEGVTLKAHGTRRRFTERDLDDVFARGDRRADGTYRVAAARLLPGRVVGGFRYDGTRPDDPNDVVPHEHRRELRALHVFGAWTNLVDMKAGNTLDSVITEHGRSFVRHYLQDVGATFGTGAGEPREADEGYEYIYEGDPTWKRLVTLGLYVPRYQRTPFEEHPEIGRFEGDRFDPEAWRPRTPVAALRQLRTDDAFWAALRVMAFTDEQIRAAVKAGEFTDPKAEALLADVLIKRRDRIGRVYFAKINPLVGFALDESGMLRFENPAVRAGFVGAEALRYQAAWARFDNATGTTAAIGSPSESRTPSLQAPPDLPRAEGTFVKVALGVLDSPHAAWATPVDVYFKRAGGGWRLVGVERLPDGAAAPARRVPY